VRALAVGNLLQAIAWLITQVTLIAAALCALSYAIGCLLKGAPIPFRDIKEAGHGLMMDAIRASFQLALWSAISSLITWIIALISSGV